MVYGICGFDLSVLSIFLLSLGHILEEPVWWVCVNCSCTVVDLFICDINLQSHPTSHSHLIDGNVRLSEIGTDENVSSTDLNAGWIYQLPLHPISPNNW